MFENENDLNEVCDKIEKSTILVSVSRKKTIVETAGRNGKC